MKIKTRIWNETPTDITIHGYRLFTDICEHASYCDYILLLMYGEQASAAQSRLLQRLAIILANRGPRKAFMHAAMSAGATGSAPASILYAASAVNSGWADGCIAVRENMHILHELQAMSSEAHKEYLHNYMARARQKKYYADGNPEHCPMFSEDDAYSSQAIEALVDVQDDAQSSCHWLRQHQTQLESTQGARLSITAIAAAAFLDLKLDPSQAELLYLWLCLPGAMAHAQEQAAIGWQHFPFNELNIILEPTGKITDRTEELQHG